MSVPPPRVSLVVPTVNRTAELAKLMENVLDQEFKDFEIIVVDQNFDDQIVPVLEEYRSRLNIGRIHTAGRRGISAAKNDGWRRASGDVIVFPDDDCWFPPWFLRKGVEVLATTRADLVSGRFADNAGRSINGRYASRAQFITRQSVWITQSEAASFYRRELLEQMDGFDEALGIGSSSAWQAAEGPDFILKALKQSRLCYFDPSIYGFHREYDLDDPAAGMVKKGRTYGRGMGFVLRRHNYGTLTLIYWASRPLGSVFIASIKGQFHRILYSLSVILGRLEGWTGHVWGLGRSVETVVTATASRPIEAVPDVNSTTNFAAKRREMTGPYRARNPILLGALYTMNALASLLPARQKEIAENRPLRVLIVNWSHLGDVVTILPLLKFLEGHPRVEELGVLIGSWSRAVVESSDITARIHVIDHWALDRSDKSIISKFLKYLSRYRDAVHELRECRYDMSIDTLASFPTAHGVTWSASIPCRIGFTSGGLGSCLTDPFDWTPDDRFMLDHQLELLTPLVGDLHPQTLPQSYPGFKSAVPKQLANIGPYIVINMGGQNVRRWVPDKWYSLARTLKEQGYELVLTGGPGGEMKAAQALSEKIPVRDLAGRQTWEQFVATVANAAAIVTINSVAGHLAACFDVPAVILAAGRQRIGLWWPNNVNAVMLTHSVGCAPCHRTNGCDAMACVRLIDVQDVLSSLRQVMELRRNGVSKSATPRSVTSPN